MTFFIYRTRTGYELANGSVVVALGNEADAIDCAVRMAQAVGGAYKINYWRP